MREDNFVVSLLVQCPFLLQCSVQTRPLRSIGISCDGFTWFKPYLKAFNEPQPQFCSNESRNSKHPANYENLARKLTPSIENKFMISTSTCRCSHLSINGESKVINLIVNSVIQVVEIAMRKVKFAMLMTKVLRK